MSPNEQWLRPLLDPRSIAILGASADPSRVGGMPFALLLQHKFAGPIYPINPKYSEINGVKCYPDIESLPEPVDLIALAVAAEHVTPQLRRAAAKGARSAVVFASGFAETGEAEGQRLQKELEDCVREIGIPVAGPNCMGFANLKSHAYTAFASVFKNIEPPRADHSVALVTQSGNVCAAVYALARKQDVGFGNVINTGNEASIEFSQYLEYFAADPATEVIAGYVEGLRDGERFRRVAQKLNEDRRPLILLKIGDSEKGAQAAASHTASLSGSQAVYRAVFDELNVIQADDLAHLADLIYVARFRKKSAGCRVAILTISGALGALLSDKFTKHGLDVPTLPDEVQAKLREGIPNYGMIANPVDLTGNVVNQYDFFAQALAAIEASHAVDMIVVYAPGYLLDRLAPAMIQVSNASSKLIAAIDTGVSKSHDALQAASIPVFDDTARGVSALSHLAKWSEGTRRSTRSADGTRAPNDAATAIIETARHNGQTSLDEVSGKQFVAAYGVPPIAERAASTADAAAGAATALGFPVVVKVLSADILHKSDCGGVVLGIESEEQGRAAFQRVTEAARKAYPKADIQGVVVQRQEKPGLEMLVGVIRDPVFGPMMTVGLGGIFTEVLKDVQHRSLPVGQSDAREMIERLKGYPLLAGVRGKPPLDIEALSLAMARVSEAFLSSPMIAELELNPLVVRTRGQGVCALDCVVTLRAQAKTSEGDVDTPQRNAAAHAA